jgi:glucose-1-phosphate cytidylyltransferase
LSYHAVSLDEQSNLVTDIHPINNGDIRINGGFFIFKKDIFRYMGKQEELVDEPFQRLIGDRQLAGYPYDGFWASMDTFKDKQQLESLYSTGVAPWEVWRARVQPALQESARSVIA